MAAPAASRFAGIAAKLAKFRQSKLGQYFGNMYNDYKTVAVETVQDAKKFPIKASFYIGSLVGTMYLVKKNPTTTDFCSQLTDYANDMATVGEPIRNPTSDAHIQYLTNCTNAGLLRRFTLGVFSVMWVDNYDDDVDLYEARCKLLKVGWLDWHERIVDYGALGHWYRLEKAMIDYDINPTEWTEK